MRQSEIAVTNLYESDEVLPGNQILLVWHVCRKKFARFLRATENAPKFSQMFLSLHFVVPKTSRKIPAGFPAKVPCNKIKKIHRRASAGAGEESLYQCQLEGIFSVFVLEKLAKLFILVSFVPIKSSGGNPVLVRKSLFPREVQSRRNDN